MHLFKQRFSCAFQIRVVCVALCLVVFGSGVLRATNVQQTLTTIGDTYLKKDDRNANKGDKIELKISENSKSHILLKFDQAAISNAVNGRQLVSAELQLYITTNWGGFTTSGRQINVHRMTDSWTEMAATWNCALITNCSQSVYWDGGTFSSTIADHKTIYDSTSGWQSFDVTSDLNAFLTGTSNYGWLIKKDQTYVSGDVDFASLQYSDSSKRPKLVLTMTNDPPAIPPPDINPAPNQNDWNNSDVTVTFTCTDSDGCSCTGPYPVTTEGQNIPVTGTCTDTLGAQSQLTVYMNIDKTPPDLEITSPLDGSVVYASEADIYGFADEELSGLVGVSCNELPVEVNEALFNYHTGLETATNEITCVGADAADNVATASISLMKLDSRETLDSVEPFIIHADSQNYELYITGTGFTGATSVLVDHETATFALVDDEHVTVTVNFSATAKHAVALLNTISGEVFDWQPGILSIHDGEAIPSLNSGSTAGGTRMKIYSYDGFDIGASVYFDLTHNVVCDASRMAADQTTYVDSNTLEVITPRAAESLSSIYVTNTSKPSITIADAYHFVTLGFSLNSDHSISVIDTTSNDTFSVNPVIDLGDQVVPTDLALSKGTNADRELYIVDGAAGNLYVYSAVNFDLLHTVVLQNPSTSPVQRWAAHQVQVSGDGAYAYIMHVSNGINGAPPNGSISVVDLTDYTLVDFDNNTGTTSSGAPSGITRIESLTGRTPLTERVLSFPRQTLEIGDKVPGDYLFLSTVASGSVNLLPICPDPEDATLCGRRITDSSLPVSIAVFDLSPLVVNDIDQNGDPVLGANPTYRTLINTIDLSSAGQYSGSNGLSFAGFTNAEDEPYVYTVSDANNRVLIVDVSTMTLLTNGQQQPVTIATGSQPSDVVVQAVTSPDFGSAKVAYVVNSGSGTLTMVDVENNSEYSSTLSPISVVTCEGASNYSLSFAPRSSGDKGYWMNSDAGSSTIIDLRLSVVSNPCLISNGPLPVKLIIQNVPAPVEVDVNSGDPQCSETRAPATTCHVKSLVFDEKFTEYVRYTAILDGVDCAPHVASGGIKEYGIEFFHDNIPVVGGTCPALAMGSSATGEWIFAAFDQDHTISARAVEVIERHRPGSEMGIDCTGISSPKVVATVRPKQNHASDNDDDGISNDLEAELMKATLQPHFMYNLNRSAEPNLVTAITVRIGPIVPYVSPLPRIKVMVNYNVLWNRDSGCLGHKYDTEPMFYIATGPTPSNKGGWSIVETETVAHDNTSNETVGHKNQWYQTVFMAEKKHGLYLYHCNGICNKCMDDTAIFTAVEPHNVGNGPLHKGPEPDSHGNLHLVNGNYEVPQKWANMITQYNDWGQVYVSPFSW